MLAYCKANVELQKNWHITLHHWCSAGPPRPLTVSLMKDKLRISKTGIQLHAASDQGATKKRVAENQSPCPFTSGRLCARIASTDQIDETDCTMTPMRGESDAGETKEGIIANGKNI